MGQDSWDYISKFILIGDSAVGKSSILVRLTDDRFLADSDPTIGVEFGSHVIGLDDGERIKVQVWDTAGSESFRSITRSYYRGAAGALLVFSLTHRPSFEHAREWLEDVRKHAEESVSIVLVGNMRDVADADAEDEDEEEGGKEPAENAAGGADEADAEAEARAGADPEAADGDAAAGVPASESASTVASGNSSSSRASKAAAQRDALSRRPGSSSAAKAAPDSAKPRRRGKGGSARQVSYEEAEAFAKKEGLLYVETSAKTGENVEEAFSRAARDIHVKFLARLAAQRAVSAGSTGGVASRLAAAGESGLRIASGASAGARGGARGGVADGAGSVSLETVVRSSDAQQRAGKGCCVVM